MISGKNVRYIEDGDLFNSNADVLVNSVNIKGIMGAGIAREFKKKFPEMYKEYSKACKRGEVYVLARFEVDLKEPKKPKLIVHEVYDWKPHIWVGERDGKKFIVLNFPTKIYWDLPSDYKIIEAGLKWLRDNIDLLSEKLGRKVRKIAMPQIGTGYGYLEWEKVKSLIERYLSNIDVEVEVYLNYSKSKSKKIPKNTSEKKSEHKKLKDRRITDFINS